MWCQAAQAKYNSFQKWQFLKRDYFTAKMAFLKPVVDRQYPARQHTPAWIALLISGALHLWAIHSFPTAPVSRAFPETQANTITVRLSPMQVPEDAVHIAPLPVKPKREKDTTRTAERPATHAGPAPESSSKKLDIVTEEPPPSPAPGSLRMDEIIQNAKRDIGKIDKELRRSFPSSTQMPPASTQSRLEKGIAAAGKPAAQTLAERTLSDGRRVTKVSGPNGIYCVTNDSVGATGGIDVMQRGMSTKVTNCGNLFD